MPKLEVYVNNVGILVYEYGPSRLKATIDYKSADLSDWKSRFEDAFGIGLELQCLVADTEARVKSDGFLFPQDKALIARKAEKVVKRVSKVFPGNVMCRSQVFPVADQIYRKNFRATFYEIYQEVMESNPLSNPRIISRYNPLLNLGLNEDFALKRSVRDMSLQDAEYAMEGIWLARKSGLDAYMIIDNYPVSQASRTCRLLEEGELPIIFSVDYENIK